jgi:hypothetical protein
MRGTLLLLPLLWLDVPACRPSQDWPATEATQVAQSATTDDSRSAVAFYDVGVNPRAIAVADFNRDGHPDVAVANAGDDTVTVLFGDGTSQLRGSTSFATGASRRTLMRWTSTVMAKST